MRALLVHLYFAQHADPDDIEEFSALARAVEVETIEQMMVPCRDPQPKYLMGSGKADEIKHIVKELSIQIVLINHAITPTQERNLSRLWECQVLDRTAVILAIFAKRARTYEGKLQVELAQLKYLSTRLVRGWTHLERQKGGIGLRGPGETQLETDKRLLRDRIKYLTARLKSVRKARQQSRRSRQRADAITISLVGYTNAGKSTLFNDLTGAMVLSADQLFATLDPTVRRMHVDQLGTVVLIDTVGFIRELPHDLIEAFRATLEETQLADLLIHVMDASDPLCTEKAAAVQTVLEQIGADHVPQLQVYNKIDKLPEILPHLDRNAQGLPEHVWVSATTKQGINLLQQAVSEWLSQNHAALTLRLPANFGRIRAQLYAQHAVQTETVTEQGEWQIEVRLPMGMLERIFADNGEKWEQYNYGEHGSDE